MSDYEKKRNDAAEKWNGPDDNSWTVSFKAGSDWARAELQNENLSLLEVAGKEHITRTMAQHEIRSLKDKLAIAKAALEKIADYCGDHAQVVAEEALAQIEGEL